ncbi:hypothetical protein BMR90_06920, partial [Leuconostoc mesenteroides subsp. cremoris]
EKHRVLQQLERLQQLEQLQKLQQLEQLQQLERLQQLEQLQKLQQLEQLQKLQQLEQLEQLQKLQQLGQLERLPKTINKDYKYFSNVKNSILYLDPPYENSDTRKYNSQIDYQEFYDWAYEMSKNNIVLLSSYEVSGDGFECVYEFKTARSTMAGGESGKRTEKLFMVRPSKMMVANIQTP